MVDVGYIHGDFEGVFFVFGDVNSDFLGRLDFLVGSRITIVGCYEGVVD